MAPSIITKLRDFVPIRQLKREEALRIAEMQAVRFRTLAGIRGPRLDERAIADLPRIHVERMSPLPVSGATAWSNGRWVILVSGSEPWARQRFSLAHELKHILDHRFISVLYEGIPEPQRHDFVEQVCDYFAGCLLMPRHELKRAWNDGTREIGALAQLFGTSQPAVQTRLAQIGLTRPVARCGVGNPQWTALSSTDSAGSSSRLYQRPVHPEWATAACEGAPS